MKKPIICYRCRTGSCLENWSRWTTARCFALLQYFPGTWFGLKKYFDDPWVRGALYKGLSVALCHCCNINSQPSDHQKPVSLPLVYKCIILSDRFLNKKILWCMETLHQVQANMWGSDYPQQIISKENHQIVQCFGKIEINRKVMWGVTSAKQTPQMIDGCQGPSLVRVWQTK